MSKNKSTKSKSASPVETGIRETSVAEAMNTAAKKPRKPADPNKVKLPWAQRQLKRTGKLLKQLHKLHTIVEKHGSAAGISSDLTLESMTRVAQLHADLQTETAQGYKPTVRSKLGEGSVIRIKSDAESRNAPVFTRLNKATGKPYLNPSDYDNAVIVGDDRTYWMVERTDGSTGAIAKNLVELA